MGPYTMADGLVFVNQCRMAREGLQASTIGEVAKWGSEYRSIITC